MDFTDRKGRRPSRTVAGLAAALLFGIAGGGLVVGVQAASAAQVGDAGRFDTWAGYSSGRYPVAVTAADFNGDGAPDVAWARHDWFHGQTPGNSMTMQLNLGDGTLGAPADFPSSDMSNDIGSADLDGDGNADVVVVSEGTSLTNATVDIYRGNGDGTFAASTVAGGEGPQRLALADLDGDGDVDIAMTNGWGSTDVSVLLNNGDATFAAEQRITVGGGQLGIVAADLDGDGDQDLAVGLTDASTFMGEVALLTNDGTGSLAVAGTVALPADDGIRAPVLAAGDLDGDGDADLAAAGGGSDSHVVLRNEGALVFTPQTYVGGYGSVNLTLADHDGDGDLDLFSATQGSSLTGDVSFFANQGDGTFAAATIIESSHQPQDVAVADFTRDGKPDIAVPNRGTSTGVIHPQGTLAAFEAPPTYVTFTAPDTVTTADLDGDGDIDVASSVPSSQVIDVKFNDGAGALTTGLTIPSSAGQPTSVWAADLNGDLLPDLVWNASAFPPQFGVALNLGGGSFGSPVFFASAGCSVGRVTTADVDNDGDQDVLAAAGGSWCFTAADTSVSISLNDGAGSFGPGTLVDLAVFQPTMVRGADVNGDGLTDLVGMSTDAWPNGDVSVAFGTGAAAFAPATPYVTGTGHREFELADFDNDGSVDLATSNLGSEDSTSVLLNDGTGNFGSPTTYPGESIPGYFNQWALDTGDVNADGNVDIAVADRTGKDLGVYFGRGDGSFDSDQMRYGMHSDFTDVELADMNGDGGLDAVGPTNPTGTEQVAGLNQSRAAAAGPGVSVLLNGSAGRGGSFVLTLNSAGSGKGKVTSDPAGLRACTTCPSMYAAGTVVTLTAKASRGSAFAGWSGAATGSNPRIRVTMTSAKAVTASFTATGPYLLTVSRSGSGKGTVTLSPTGIAPSPTGPYSYAAGTRVTLTAEPANGSTFTGWSGAVAGTSSTVRVTMTAAKSVTATFTKP